MKDRFKFRCWDDDAKKMLYASELDGLHICIGMDGGLKYTCHLKQYKSTIYWPLFCTGLRDKNDILIFEGDLLNFSSDEKEQIIWQIVWNQVSAAFEATHIESRSKSLSLDCLNICRGSVVVGNIYEKPELLVKKD